MRVNAIVLREYGGPEVLRSELVEVPPLHPNQILLRHTAIGVNFHDTLVRTGVFRTLKLPGIPGIEAAGVVEDIGSAITRFKKGDRVAYIDEHHGAYAEVRVVYEELAIPLPDHVTDNLAAAIMIKGLTAQMLVRQVHPVKKGEYVLVQAAAGGVGRLVCQWAASLGGIVIGTVSTDEKAAIARDAGCQYTINYALEKVTERVEEITEASGVGVVFDGVGRATFSDSLSCLGLRGHFVSFGQSSGPVAPVRIPRFPPTAFSGGYWDGLGVKSNSISRPTLYHYISTRQEYETMCADLFKMIECDALRFGDAKTYPLTDAAAAHTEIGQQFLSAPAILLP